MTPDRFPDGPEDHEGPERRHPSDDQVWDDIVARLRPDMPAAPPAEEGRRTSAEGGRPAPPHEPPAPAAPWPVLHPEPDEDEELPGEFVPPEPPPVLSGRPSLVLAASALLLPILALLILAVLPVVSLPGWALFALVLVAAGGGVGLFLQLPRRGDGRGDRLDRGAQI
ncbi:hypothetical protein FM125_06890 [Micrococcus lylae]|uniref:DUF308 domain-containing protein n=1 Tax=Micrococcus lylae TaxID=1273 RepID=A0A1R4J775_9MICC|nr:hypothetical protein [Micrococcus lylae]SJN27907.1 hypothetical protein FM125_06890 [Micrococcus lylae]